MITSAATLGEVVHSRINRRPTLEWTLPRRVMEPVTEPVARHADADLHDHEYTFDVVLSATASPPVGWPGSRVTLFPPAA